MIKDENRQYLDFEKPIQELVDQLINLKQTSAKGKVNLDSSIKQLEKDIVKKRVEISKHLNTWQRIQLSRHPDRPYAISYIESICSDFIELHGDRKYKDDKAIVGGIGKIGDYSTMIISQQKGKNMKMRQYRNFGMPNPDGYRKAHRLMKMAEKFNLPIITMVDTPGAFPGIEAEDRGQGEAIARNIIDMVGLKVPVICCIIGEGASGGALGIGVGDAVLMFENSWFSVISPESCSTILWRTTDKKATAAEQLKPTSYDMLSFKIVDEIVPEPSGGSHWDYSQSAENLNKLLLKYLKKLSAQDAQQRINNRINRYCSIGYYDEKQQK